MGNSNNTNNTTNVGNTNNTNNTTLRSTVFSILKEPTVPVGGSGFTIPGKCGSVELSQDALEASIP